MAGSRVLLIIALTAGLAAPATHAQETPPDMSGMAGMHDMPGMQHPMNGLLGNYPMARESSGTSWQPESARMSGAMVTLAGWSLMGEGNVTVVGDHQGGPRGDAQTFATSMGMLMGAREISATDRLGLRAMLSLDPSIGASGYPLLFATGETADGRTPLIDRQHPHDLFMELAGSWMHDLGHGKALSLYAGLPGEPALGPPTFMHRVSGMDNPEAPIGHHWFDSTHITFGVVTAGLSSAAWKLEASAFRGREPDERRWDIETPTLDSWSMRAFWNPSRDLSLQLSTGHLHSPEQLEPDRNEQRTTVSATWNVHIGERATWASTIAWSAKDENPGPTLRGFLAESAVRFGRHEVFARAEHEQESELFDDAAAAGNSHGVSKLSFGYQHEWPLARALFVDVGGLVSAYGYAATVRSAYGADGLKSFIVYARLRLGS